LALSWVSLSLKEREHSWLPVGLIIAAGMLLTLWFWRCVLRYFLLGGNADTPSEAVVGRAMHDRTDAGGQSRGVTADAA